MPTVPNLSSTFFCADAGKEAMHIAPTVKATEIMRFILCPPAVTQFDHANSTPNSLRFCTGTQQNLSRARALLFGDDQPLGKITS